MEDTRISIALKRTLLGVCGLLIVLLVFHAGVALGERRAFDRVRPRPGLPAPGLMPHAFLPDGHGAVGTIEKISSSGFVLNSRDGESEEIDLTASSTIKEGSRTLTLSDLAAGQGVVVIGEPDGSEARIQAELVRVLH